jgi:integrase
MATLRRDPASGSWVSRKEVPADIRDAYAAIYKRRREEMFRQPADCPAGRAKVLFSEWQADIDSRFAAVRAQQRGQGHELTQRQAHALAGEWSRWFVGQHEDDPSDPRDWEEVHWELWHDFRVAIHEDDPAIGDDIGMVDESTREYLRKNVYPRLTDTANQFLASRGEPLAPAAMDMFLRAMVREALGATSLLRRRAAGDYTLSERPTSSMAMPERERTSTAIGYTSGMQLFEAYIPVAKLAPETTKRWRGVFTELDAHLAGRGFDALSDGEAQEWVTSLVTPKRSAETVKQINLTALKALGRWAVKQRRIARNPFEDCSIKIPKKTYNRETKAYSTDEIRLILSNASAIQDTRSPSMAARRWVFWICAYTGARAGEITQLRGQDIVERDGIKAIRITPEAGANKTKRARIVPIHEHLIAQGLLNYAKVKGSGPLFYNGSTSDTANTSSDVTNPKRARSVNVRSNLARWIRSIGISDTEVGPTHGWRHSFKQIADRCGISDRVSDAITGHTPPSKGREY